MFFGFLKPKPKYPEVDRRRELRLPAEDEFVLEFQANHSHYIGSSRDVSIHGVRFVSTCKLKPSQKIILNFRFPHSFPGEQKFSVKATVARVYLPRGANRYRVGCSLQHESDVTEEAMRQFVFWLESRSGSEK